MPVQQQRPPQPPSNPLQPTYQGAPTWLNPSYTSGAQSSYNTNLPAGAIAALSPQATIQQILQGFAPQSAQATTALNNSLAASGIVGGPAATAQSELQGQLAASLAPTLANAIQTSQGNVLGAQEFQSGQGLQQALANAQLGEQTGLANQSAANQMGEFNVGNQIGANQFNATQANQAGSQLAQMLYGGWGQQLGDFAGLNSQELGGLLGLEQGGLSNLGELAYGAENNFPVMQGGDWSGLGYGLQDMLGGGGSGSGSDGGFPWWALGMAA